MDPLIAHRNLKKRTFYIEKNAKKEIPSVISLAL